MRQSDVIKIINNHIKINHSDLITDKLIKIKQKIKNQEILPDDGYKKLLKIKIGSCPICGFDLYLFDYLNCPKIGKEGRKDKDKLKCDPFELKHIEYRSNILKETIKIARNFIDQSEEGIQKRMTGLNKWKKENNEIFIKNSKENIKKANEYWKLHPKEAKENSLKALKQANLNLKNCWQDEKWKNTIGLQSLEHNRNIMLNNQKLIGFLITQKMNEINKERGFPNLKLVHEKMKELWQDEKWRSEVGEKVLKNLKSYNLNIKDFYEEPLNLINLNYNNIKVDADNLLNTIISGVWSIWNIKTNECLQVGQNEDIFKEFRREIRLFEKYYINNYPKDHKEADYWHELGVLYKNKFLEFKIIAKNIDLSKRLIIEMQYAHDNKAKYWSLQPNSIQQEIILNT